jgi:hypothetical protein
MDVRSVQTGETPIITLNISGNLSVKGWDKLEIVAKSPSRDDLVLDVQEDAVSLNCRTNCSLRVPYGSVFQDCHITGDATFKSLENELTISNLSGNLSLRSIGSAKIGSVNGNLVAKNVDGSISLEKCQGNVSVRDIQGDLMIAESIAGNLTLKDIDGNARAEARGNVSVENRSRRKGQCENSRSRGAIADRNAIRNGNGRRRCKFDTCSLRNCQSRQPTCGLGYG